MRIAGAVCLAAALAALSGCDSGKPKVATVAAAPPAPETSRLSASLCSEVGRPRGFRVEREALAPVLAVERGPSPDYRRAFERTYALARGGNSLAILHLSDLYGNRATGFADAAEQARLFDCALRLGSPEALVRQGLALSAAGAGRPRAAGRADRLAAIGLFERAANLGDMSGVNALAGFVAAGRSGYPRSAALGREIREACAATGDAACLRDLAGDLEAEGNIEGAFFWMDVLTARAAAQADVQRRDALARRLDAGQVRRTRASTGRWRRLSWEEVRYDWTRARDRLAAAL